MKKTLLVICFALIGHVSFAQHLGIKAGPTYTTIKGNTSDNYGFRTGYTGGVMYQHHFTQSVGIQTEALFTSKGARREFEAGGNTIEEKLRLNYIDVPVMLHLSTGGVFFDAGPQVSFLAKGRQLRQVSSDRTTTTMKTNITDDPHAIDFGFVAGLGYRYVNGAGVEVRYNGGLKNIDDEGPFVGQKRRNSTSHGAPA